MNKNNNNKEYKYNITYEVDKIYYTEENHTKKACKQVYLPTQKNA